MSENPPLAIRSIQCDLTEALGELKDLWVRIQLAVFGRILDKELELRKEYVDVLKRLPLTDSALFFSLAHAYHHLNFAWNSRRSPEGRGWACRLRTGVSATRRTQLRRARFPWVFVVLAAGG